MGGILLLLAIIAAAVFVYFQIHPPDSEGEDDRGWVSLYELPPTRSRGEPVFFRHVTLRPKVVLNRTEGSVYETLLKAVPPGYWIFPQVRLADVVDVVGSRDWDRQSAFNRLGSKHVDFAIVRFSDRQCLAVIEVDGPTHQTDVQKQRDAVKDEALNQAGIHCIRIPARTHSLDEMRYVLRSLWSTNPEMDYSAASRMETPGSSWNPQD